jgi:hypothetical protein
MRGGKNSKLTSGVFRLVTAHSWLVTAHSWLVTAHRGLVTAHRGLVTADQMESNSKLDASKLMEDVETFLGKKKVTF